MLRLESEGGLYHVINRGNYRANIFHSEVGAKQSGPGGCGIKAAPVGDGAWSTAEKSGKTEVRPSEGGEINRMESRLGSRDETTNHRNQPVAGRKPPSREYV